MTHAANTQELMTAERTRLEQMTLAMVKERGLKINNRRDRPLETIRSIDALMVSWETQEDDRVLSEAEILASTAEIEWVLDVIRGINDSQKTPIYRIMTADKAILVWSWIRRNAEITPSPESVVSALSALTEPLRLDVARKLLTTLLESQSVSSILNNMSHDKYVIRAAWNLIDALNSTAPKKSPVIQMPEELIAARTRGNLTHAVAQERSWDQTPPEALGWQALHDEVHTTTHAAAPAPVPNTVGPAPTVMTMLQLLANQQRIIIEQNNRIAAALGV